MGSPPSAWATEPSDNRGQIAKLMSSTRTRLEKTKREWVAVGRGAGVKVWGLGSMPRSVGPTRAKSCRGDRGSNSHRVSVPLDGIVTTLERLEVDKRMHEFQASALSGLRLFAVDKDLENKFDKPFGGMQALPACFEEERRELLKDSPLEASALLVSLPFKKPRAHLFQAFQWSEAFKLSIANLPYDPNLGLLLEHPNREVEDWGD